MKEETCNLRGTVLWKYALHKFSARALIKWALRRELKKREMS